MSFSTASAILRGKWLIEKNYANAHMPLVMSVLKGETKASALLGFDDDDDDDDIASPDQTRNIGGNVYSVYPGSNLSSLPSGCIAFVDIDGPMLKQGDWCSYGMDDYAELMYGLLAADNIAGVIIDIDSPGGQANGTATLSDAINALKAVKPVMGFVDDGMAASAAYWSISACTEIYCSQSTDQVGSIGVYCSVADWYAYYASLGLPVKDVYAPGSDDKNADYRESIAGNDDLLKAELLVIKNAFVSAVKSNRKGKIQGTDWSTGKMYFPDEALSLGLIDGVKSFDQVAWRLNRMISSINKNSNSTQTNTSMKFSDKHPKLAAFLGIKAEDKNEDVQLDLSTDNLEALVAERDNLLADKKTLTDSFDTLNTTLSEKESAIIALSADNATLKETIATLEEDKVALNDKITELGNLTAGNFTTASADKDRDQKTDKVDPMAFGFQKEILDRL